MNDQAEKLRQDIEQKKDCLKSQLLNLNYFKTPDGKQLYELNLHELEQIYENVKARKGVDVS